MMNDNPDAWLSDDTFIELEDRHENFSIKVYFQKVKDCSSIII